MPYHSLRGAWIFLLFLGGSFFQASFGKDVALCGLNEPLDPARPYELEWAHRTNDTRAATFLMEGSNGWKVVAKDGVAALSTARERKLWGAGVMRMIYRATGENPVFRIRPEKTCWCTNGEDTISVWIYGNTTPAFQPDPQTPVTLLYADILDSAGKRFTVMLSRNNFKEWFLARHHFTAAEKARTAQGWRFAELIVTHGKNREERALDFTSLCIFRDDFQNVKLENTFRDASGKSALPGEWRDTKAPTSQVVPPIEVTPSKDFEFRFPADPLRWDDLAVRYKGGAWIPLAIGGGVFGNEKLEMMNEQCGALRTPKVQVDFKRVGNSVVCEVNAPGGDVSEVRWGEIHARDNQEFVKVPLPYYKFDNGKVERPSMMVMREGTNILCASHYLNWEYSWGSVVSARGVSYLPKTNGRRNDVREQFVWALGVRFNEALPQIPNNPISPYKKETAARVWIVHGASTNRAADVALWRARHKAGLKDMIVTDHEGMWRDGYESFTYRTRTAPAKGGDKAQYDYTRVMIDELGYLYGPYNCFCEMAPVNAYWNENQMLRLPDGNFQVSWERCFVPKPLFAPAACKAIAAEVQRKFRFNTGYCDVHTCVSPWSRVDYDERVPGAGMFRETFRAFGEVFHLQRTIWGGPVYSEGSMHWLYAGLVDGNYAQDQEYGFADNPWLVDFDLYRIHPKCVNFGMGTMGMFYGASTNRPSSSTMAADRFLSAELAFGHSAFLIWADGLMRSYYMVKGVASRYGVENVERIRYANGAGELLDTEAAILSGAYRLNRIAVDYTGGMHVIVNGNSNEMWCAQTPYGNVMLPPNGWCVWGKDVCSISALKGGKRVDRGLTNEWLYQDERDGKGATVVPNNGKNLVSQIIRSYVL